MFLQICQNPSCPTVVEPFTNRLICQCYNRPADQQPLPVSSMQQNPDNKVEPALYNSAYLRVNSPDRKGVRVPQVRLSYLQGHANFVFFASTTRLFRFLFS